ncbi:hypothetical protein GW17_00053965 [Ensete ventricosum]|nr:hypothetical protein GW17_00053965 [Ensete ventricosum]
MSRKGYRCETTDNRAMSLVVSWYRRGGTSVEALIPCSHEGRVLVAKGADEVENAEANSKYQDRAVGVNFLLFSSENSYIPEVQW